MSDEHWFEYHGERLSLFYHLYNITGLNERCVELAVARKFLDPMTFDERLRGLEVGNVLGHYDKRYHLVFDLHEKPAWYQEQPVEPVDILDIQWPEWTEPDGKTFPWVISISTIEHTADPIAALSVMTDLVRPGGSLLVTFPTGVRDALDMIVTYGAAGMSDRFCTVSREENDHGGWAQDPEPRVTEYGPWANTVAILEWTAP